MMSFVHSIKFRFTAWYLLVLALLIGALSAGVYFTLSRSLYTSLDNSLQLRAVELQRSRGMMGTMALGQFQEELGEVVIVYYESQGEVGYISARDANVTLDTALVQRALDGEEVYTTISTEDGRKLRFDVVPFVPEGPTVVLGRPGAPVEGTPVTSAAIAVGRSTEDIDNALAGLMRTLAIAGPLTLAVAGGGGVFLARRALKPVDQIARTAHEIEESDLSRRVPVQSKDELGRLASTLNQMIERLEKAFKRQRQFTGDASHELRTPLAVIQAESTLALKKDRSPDEYKQSLEVVSRESGHMSKVIDQLLTLARADSGKERLSLEEIDLGDLLLGIGGRAETLCREQGLEFRLERMDAATVNGDRSKLRTLLLNLLDNAIRYSPDGGTVSLRLRKVDGMAVIDVADTGIGIPEADIPYIFERFYRVDKARSRAEGGAGLGLAIAGHIAETHGGRIEVASQLGKGSTFSLWLPAID
jgi:heavy metal sensor kinase